MANAADELKQVPFFEGLSERHLKRLATKFKERRFAPGTSVVQEGKMSGIGFFIITEGEASVVVDGNEVTTLGKGDHFGELALIAERERTATVTAQTPLSCLEITAWDLRDFVKSDPDVSWRLLQYVVGLFLVERGSPGGRP